MKASFYKFVSELDSNIHSYIITLISGKYSGAKTIVAGRKLCPDEDGLIFPGSAARDATLTDDFRSWLRDNEAELESVDRSGVLEIGGFRAYAELLGQERRLVICGAGHVSMPIITLGKLIGMHVVVIDDRERFAGNARKQGADEVLCMEFAEAISTLASNNNTYFVIATRGHVCDMDCLRSIVALPHAYIGLLGSRKRTTKVREDLAAEGIARSALADVHTPIGLNIGAETPEEIAVSILAEIIEVKNREKSYGFPRDIMDVLSDEGRDEVVLATIIARHGSSPRDMGTKMIIKRTGEIVGTVGGGFAEAEVIMQGARMLEERRLRPRIMHSDMSVDDADGREMMCGGKIDVLLELA